MTLIRALIFLAVSGFALQAAKPLDFYLIDVEGGKCVLMVSPSGESLLYDAGWPGQGGRDNKRIVEAAKAAGLKQIDYLVISHYDVDHLGDVPALLAAFPVKHIIDNGSLQTPGADFERRYKPFAEARDAMAHSVVPVGEKLPIKGVDVTVVSAGTKVLSSALPGAGQPNPACGAISAKPEIKGNHEDNMSIGLLFTSGKFRMLDLADLEAFYSYKLVCPNNLVGTVDVYNVAVHAQEKGISGALEPTLHARVFLVGNGARKGGDAVSWPVMRGVPGLEDIWQSHFSVAGGKEKNPPDDFIANLDENCQGKWLKLSAKTDGSFTITNGRNEFTKTYKARK
jgi:beta-lactamase superfamily II metal-dependent hydrolase